MTSGVSCEQLAEPNQQQQNSNTVPVQQQQQQQQQQQENIQQEEQANLVGGRQFRSESGDSGQLSLISSFGSISINQIANGQQNPRLKQRLASESSQEFSGSNYVDYQQYCSLILLNSLDCCEEDQAKYNHYNQHQFLHESLKSLPIDKQQKQESLADRRARWFAGLEQQFRGPGGVDGHCCCGEGDQQKQLERIQSIDRNINNKQVGEDCEKSGKSKSKKGGKKFVAALAATQSSLMDKFWTHMVKRGAPLNNSTSSNGKGLDKQATQGEQQQQQQVLPINSGTTTTTQSSGGIHLLTDLSRRLVRRCGGAKQAKVNRVQSTSESALESSNSTANKRIVGVDHQVESVAVKANEHKRGAAFLVSPTSASCQQLNGTGGVNNLNASVSTLNTTTTPSGCCYCDNETCSSSGFVSSSTANTAPAPISSVASRATGGTNSPSSMTAATSNCCNESIANRSCSSSTHNDQHFIGATTASSPTKEQELHRQHPMSASIEELKSSNKDIVNHVGGIDQLEIVGAAATGAMAAADPNSLAVHHLKQSQLQGSANTTIIETSLDDGNMIDAAQVQGEQISNTSEEQTKNTLKPKESLLNRARNSNINIASLAPITSRFNYSASVGNLWNHHHGHRSHSPNSLANIVGGELLTPENDKIQTLEYIACQTFDEVKPEHQDAICKKSHSSNKLLGAQSRSGSSRKSSTKEKCRRQKDTERVEKLRLLVSYLRSGSSQPVVSPVTLEADEIELAERYKLHIALRDDLLNRNNEDDILHSPPSGDHQKSADISPVLSSASTRNSQSPAQTTATVTAANTTTIASAVATSNTSPSTSSCSMSQNHRSSIGVVNYSAGLGSIHSSNIDNNNENGDDAKKSADPTVSTTRSIPQIGQISWVLRHSISDPGNKYDLNFACNASADCSSTSGARSSTVSAFLPNQQNDSMISQFSPKIAAISAGQVVQKSLDPPSSSHQRTKSCKITGNNHHVGHSDHNINNSSTLSSSVQPQPQKQPARLFYIDDIDAPHAQLPQTGPKSNECQHLMSTPVANINVSMGTMMTQATSSGNFTSSICSSDSQQSPTTATVPAANTTLSSSKSCSAWTNPQNLATWIDNEVKSLVHDLEVNESQQKFSGDSNKNHHSGQKHNSRQSEKSSSSNSSCKNKDGKRKWLSVTGASSRRSSSGAQST